MPRSLFLRLAIRADDDTGLAKLLHAADHVLRAGRAPIPERQEHVACLPGVGYASPRLMMPCTAACSAARHPGSGANRSAAAP